ncbi:Hsp33 family molecular chaperone HslO [Alcaligenaceae bacterium CGII-47]|nr:Hsp33 family molecular chaperone HslO [Alcaligenaceae bacterium CGII-47]
MSTDTLKKYLSPDHTTRVQTVNLTESWQTGLAHQNYPPVVQSLLGELAAAAVLLAGNIKFNGAIVLQLQGNGPVHLIVVECTSGMGVRATAHLREHAQIAPDDTLQDLLNADGKGKFTVMLDPSDKQAGMPAYQGIVPLEGTTVAQVLESYMRNSEQLDTRLWLGADAQHCSGLLLQRLPDEGGRVDDTLTESCWVRFIHLADTLKDDELLTLDSNTLIHRLFWQEDLLAFDPQHIRWQCSCTRERVSRMLRTLGQTEINSIVAQQGQIEVSCNFCGKPYLFDSVDCARLLIETPELSPEHNPTLH